MESETVSINIVKDKEKYRKEVERFSAQLMQLDQQRATFIQAITERRGILIYLNGLDGIGKPEVIPPKEEGKALDGSV